jgi:peptide/nickel transport system substrate-binding protein
MRRTVRSTAVCAALILVAVGCSKSTPAADHSGSGGGGVVEGGVLRIGSSSNIDSLNPFKAFQQDAYNVFQYTYPYLVGWDTTNLTLVGDWATDWTWNADHTSVTFNVMTNGKWSDGQPLTAADAAYTINLLIKYPGPTGLEGGYARHIVTAEAPNSGTLTIGYEAPVNEDWALSQFQQIPILPQHVWSKQEGDAGKGLRTFTNDAPIVSGGPFTLTKYSKDEFVQMDANPGYYGTKPHIDGWGLKFYTNADAMVSALQNGEIDAVESVPAAALANLKANPNLVVSEAPGIYFDDFIINSNKPLHPELLDPKVREAFDYAIDRQSMVDTVLLGHGAPASTIVSPSTGHWHNSDIAPTPYDITHANQLLDTAGYPKGSDGIRTANGKPMTYEILTPSNVDGVDREFEIIQASFQQIGVKVTQKSLDPSAMFDLMAGANYNSYDNFDLALWDWYPLPDPDFILSVLTCQQYGFWSDTGYCNKAYDALYNKQGLIVSPADREKVVWQMQQMIHDDRPYLIMMNRNVLEAHTSKWDGFVMSPIGSFTAYSKQTLTQVHQVG